MQRDGVRALTPEFHNQKGTWGLLQMGFTNGRGALVKWVCLPFLFWKGQIIHHLHFPATPQWTWPQIPDHTSTSNYAEDNLLFSCSALLMIEVPGTRVFWDLYVKEIGSPEKKHSQEHTEVHHTSHITPTSLNKTTENRKTVKSDSIWSRLHSWGPKVMNEVLSGSLSPTKPMKLAEDGDFKRWFSSLSQL